MSSAFWDAGAVGLERGAGDDPKLFLAVRRAGAGALVAAVVVLCLIDALSDHFEVDPVTLGLLLSGALLFAGIQGRLK